MTAFVQVCRLVVAHGEEVMSDYHAAFLGRHVTPDQALQVYGRGVSSAGSPGSSVHAWHAHTLTCLHHVMPPSHARVAA